MNLFQFFFLIAVACTSTDSTKVCHDIMTTTDGQAGNPINPNPGNSTATHMPPPGGPPPSAAAKHGVNTSSLPSGSVEIPKQGNGGQPGTPKAPPPEIITVRDMFNMMKQVQETSLKAIAEQNERHDVQMQELREALLSKGKKEDLERHGLEVRSIEQQDQ